MGKFIEYNWRISYLFLSLRHQKTNYLENMKKKNYYQTPIVEIIEGELSNVLASSFNEQLQMDDEPITDSNDIL
jgi:hypothetical protein